jgi:hypothetical protein
MRRAVLDDHPHPAAPTRKAMVQHRLGVVVGQSNPQLPALTALAEALLLATYDAWGEVLLELAPAFR